MFQNYLKIALRNIVKHKGYAFINLAGLTTGIAMCLLLFLWVKDELSYDRFHANADRMYRASWKARFGDNEWNIEQVPAPLAPALEQEFPEVEWATQAVNGSFIIKKGEAFVREKSVLFVDEDFPKVFTIDVVEGNLTKALDNQKSIVLSEAMAVRYFGEGQNIVGRNIILNDGEELEVGAVVKSFPEQSHLTFNCLASIKRLKFLENRKDDWSSATCLTYFTVHKEASTAKLEQNLNAWVDENLMTGDMAKGNNFTSFPFTPVTDIHLKPNLSYIWMFGIIGAFILVMACVNFVNLSTARALTRAREVGVRKALGSLRSQLVHQFFSEAFVFVVLSLVLAVGLAITAIPLFNIFSGKNLNWQELVSPFSLLLLLGLALFTTLLTGALPARVLSAFQPVKVLKGDISRSGTDGSRARQGLVVFQFTISIALIIGTLVVKHQLDFLHNHNLGFEQDNVLVVRRAQNLAANYDPFMAELKSLAAVEQVSSAQFLPGDEFDSSIFFPEQPSNYTETSLAYTFVGETFVDVLQLKLAQGRNFDLGRASDSTALLINQTAAKRLGWDDPIGRKLTFGGSEPGKVVGVVEDFNFQTLHETMQPIVMMVANWKMPNIVLRLHPGNLENQLENIESLWRKMAPQAPFEFSFLDEEIQQLYEQEQQMSKVFLLFSGLAIFIACLGLLGLAAFIASQRLKEIGIRKVLGASTFSIVSLLSNDFLMLVVVALLAASPLAWYFMDKWLAQFAYRIDMPWSVFLLAGAMAVSVAFLTVSFQSIKAALSSPVKALRSE